jgi:regulator of replication initiation timing
MKNRIFWFICMALICSYGRTVKADMTTEESAANAENTLSQAAQDIKTISNDRDIISNQTIVLTPDSFIPAEKLTQVKTDLLQLEQDYLELHTQINNLKEHTDKSGEHNTVLNFERCVVEAQKLHAVIANIAFFANSAKNSRESNSISEIKSIAARISGGDLARLLPALSSGVQTETMDNFQQYSHDYEYHLRGIQRATKQLTDSSTMSGIQRPFPIPEPIPIPPVPYHPPVTPGPSPSQPDNSDVEGCKDDCSSQYDADCDACGQYVTDARARALCYSSAASRQGICIRNCYHH